jgi:dephospho-CoA kinase
MIFKVGLTGGIGSGKTTVAKVFELLGVPVYYADEASKRLYHTELEADKGNESSIRRTDLYKQHSKSETSC